MPPSELVDVSQLSLDDILLKRKSLKRKLSAREGLQPVRIAVMGGSTTNEVVDLLEIWLLDSGYAPTFYQSEYGRYYVESVHDTHTLVEFRPDIVYVHTSVINVQAFPAVNAGPAELESAVAREMAQYREIFTSIEEKLGCLVIQNNFEFPPYAILGNLDATVSGGHTHFVTALNLELATAAQQNPKLLIHDVCSLSARLGLGNWFDPARWFGYKLVTSAEGSRAIAVSLCSMVRAIYGKTRKVLVLDLDNTIWGGVIGDDGPNGIKIGRETPVAEAYTAFQEYCLSLRDRGVLLAVCSKNDEEVAKQGFEHPDAVLKLEHIACFKANWEPKHENILQIARELNLGADSFVFVDDNPAEREIVRGQIQGIAVPEVGNDVVRYAEIIEAGRYFELTSLSAEDVARAAQYQENAERSAFEAKFANYGEYLDSLEMTAEIDRFKPVYIERIAQLTNKTNQFNLTTKRYTLAEMQTALSDPEMLGIYGKLTDRFGDNGLISVVLGRKLGDVLDLDLWLMSCRVLKREMEQAMLDAAVVRAKAMGVTSLQGHYLPTKKNGMVRDHYSNLGFSTLAENEDGSVDYELLLTDYQPRTAHIRILEGTHEQ